MSTQVKPNVDLTIDRDFNTRNITINRIDTSSGLPDLIDKPDSKKNVSNMDIFDTSVIDEFRKYSYDNSSIYDAYKFISSNKNFSIMDTIEIHDDGWTISTESREFRFAMDYIGDMIQYSQVPSNITWTVSQYPEEEKSVLKDLKDPEPIKHRSPAELLKYLGLGDTYEYYLFDDNRPPRLEDVLYELRDSGKAYDYSEDALLRLTDRLRTSNIPWITQNFWG